MDIPVFLKGRDGEGDGIVRRQCTENYKIRTVRRRVRELLGLRRGQKVPPGRGSLSYGWASPLTKQSA